MISHLLISQRREDRISALHVEFMIHFATLKVNNMGEVYLFEISNYLEKCVPVVQIL